jgi:hypothetical protein
MKSKGNKKNKLAVSFANYCDFCFAMNNPNKQRRIGYTPGAISSD